MRLLSFRNQHTLPPYQPPYLPSQALSAVPLLSIKQALSPLVMGSVKEEKGALDYFPCMSVDGQKHLHARMWSTSLPSSTPTGIALRGRGFWKGLPVVSFGGRAIALDCVERLTEMAGYVNRLEERRHDCQYCHGCYCLLLPQCQCAKWMGSNHWRRGPC